MMPLFRTRRVVGGAALALSLMLTGCASAPNDQFYTLSGGPTTAAPAATTGAPLYFEMRPITVPAQVRRPQLVTSSADGRVDLEEHHRWAGPLADEIGTGLSLGIAAELGAIDVYRSPAPKGSTLYRVGANIQRFESVPGSYALIDAVWNVRKLDDSEVQTCRSVFREPVGAGYDALVAGHRAALAKLAAAIAAGVRGQAEGRAPGC